MRGVPHRAYRSEQAALLPVFRAANRPCVSLTCIHGPKGVCQRLGDHGRASKPPWRLLLPWLVSADRRAAGQSPRPDAQHDGLDERPSRARTAIGQHARS